MIMRYLLYAVISCICIFPLQGQEYNGTIVIHNGLKENGKHVCYYNSTIYKKVNVSYEQQTLRTRVVKTCNWIGICKYKRIQVVVKVKRYTMLPKEFRVKNLVCCNGWMKNSEHDRECIKPICGVPCQHGGKCIAPDKCQCEKGFEGEVCQLVIDDCGSEKRNDCEQICIPKVPGHKCACKTGWKLKTDGKHCRDVNECRRKHPPCKCKVDDGVCKATCHNLEGGYECRCPEGYYLNSAEECEDVNECYLHPDLCDQICKNTPGSYECKCMDGYKLDKKTNKCVDVDECKKDNGGCSDKCINIEGSYLCACPHGFYLDKDKKTCKVIKPTMKNIVICQSDLVGQINCNNYEEKIMIIDAMYGRLTKDYCQHGNFTQDLRCVSKTSPLKPLMAACDNQASCVIFIEKEVFGDPCPQIEKYLQVTYDCMK